VWYVQAMMVFSVAQLWGLPMYCGLKTYEVRMRPHRRDLGKGGKREVKVGSLLAMRVHPGTSGQGMDVKWLKKYEDEVLRRGHSSIHSVARRVTANMRRVGMICYVDFVLQVNKEEAKNIPQHHLDKLGMWDDERCVKYRNDYWSKHPTSIMTIIHFGWTRELVSGTGPMIMNVDVKGDLRQTPAWLMPVALEKLKHCQVLSDIGREQV
jgi:hypothetical protein